MSQPKDVMILGRVFDLNNDQASIGFGYVSLLTNTSGLVDFNFLPMIPVGPDDGAPLLTEPLFNINSVGDALVTRVPVTDSILSVHDIAGAVYTPARGLLDNSDGQAVNATNFLVGAVTRPSLFNGTSFDRARSASAANIGTTTNLDGVAIAAQPGHWAINHTPVANTQATISRAAGTGTQRHVATSIVATLSTDTAAVAANVLLNLRDGATGAGTILWSTRLLINTNVATIGGAPIAGIAISGLSIPGSLATAMTLEFAAAGGANTFEAVALTGYTAGANG